MKERKFKKELRALARELEDMSERAVREIKKMES